MTSIPIIHVRGSRAEPAAILISDEAATRASLLSSNGIEVRIRQVPADEAPPVEAVPTVGVVPVDSNGQALQRIEVALVHRRGRIKALWCFNETGEESPIATAQKLILSVTQEEITAWLQTHV